MIILSKEMFQTLNSGCVVCLWYGSHGTAERFIYNKLDTNNYFSRHSSEQTSSCRKTSDHIKQ